MLLNWQRVGKFYYRISDIYSYPQNNPNLNELIDPKRILLSTSTVAICPIGGPIAAILNRHLHIFTPSYRRLVDIELDFLTSLIAGLWWCLTPEPTLVIVLTDGTVKIATLKPTSIFEILTRNLSKNLFSKDPILAVSPRLNGVKSSSFVVLTQSMNFYTVNNNGWRPGAEEIETRE